MVVPELWLDPPKISDHVKKVIGHMWVVATNQLAGSSQWPYHLVLLNFQTNALLIESRNPLVLPNMLVSNGWSSKDPNIFSDMFFKLLCLWKYCSMGNCVDENTLFFLVGRPCTTCSFLSIGVNNYPCKEQWHYQPRSCLNGKDEHWDLV